MPPAAINRPPAAPAPQSPWPPHARVIKKRIGGTPSRRRRRKAARAFYAPHAWGALESRPFTTDHPRDCGERLRTLYHRVAACPWGLSFAASNRPWAVTPCAAPWARPTTPPACRARGGRGRAGGWWRGRLSSVGRRLAAPRSLPPWRGLLPRRRFCTTFTQVQKSCIG